MTNTTTAPDQGTPATGKTERLVEPANQPHSDTLTAAQSAARARGQKITTAAEIRELRKGVPYMLPGSGHVVRLKKTSLLALAAATGNVPNTLPEELLRWEAVRAATDAQSEDQQIATYKENALALIQAAAVVMIEPRLAVGRPAQDDEIEPEDLAQRDLMWIMYTFILGTVDAVRPFRIET